MEDFKPEPYWPVWGQKIRIDEGHEGHMVHGHGEHAGELRCSCGEVADSYSYWPLIERPTPCPICKET